MTTPLERLARLRDHLLSLDSGSGEAADLALAFAVIVHAQELGHEYDSPAPDYTMRNVLRQRLAKSVKALTTESTNDGK